MEDYYQNYARPITKICVKEVNLRLIEWKNSLKNELQGLIFLRKTINNESQKTDNKVKKKVTEIINKLEGIILNEVDNISGLIFEIERERIMQVENKLYVKFELIRDNYNKIMLNIHKMKSFSPDFSSKIENMRKNNQINNDNTGKTVLSNKNNLNNCDDLKVNYKPYPINSNNNSVKHLNYNNTDNNSISPEKFNNLTSNNSKNLNNITSYDVDNEINNLESRINQMKNNNTKNTNKADINNTTRNRTTKSQTPELSRTNKASSTNFTGCSTNRGQSNATNIKTSENTNYKADSKTKRLKKDNSALSLNKTFVKSNYYNNTDNNAVGSNNNKFYLLNQELSNLKSYVEKLDSTVKESLPIIEIDKESFLKFKEDYFKLLADYNIMKNDLVELNQNFQSLKEKEKKVEKENNQLRQYNNNLLTVIKTKFPEFDENYYVDYVTPSNTYNNLDSKNNYENNSLNQAFVHSTVHKANESNFNYYNHSLSMNKSESNNFNSNFNNKNESVKSPKIITKEKSYDDRRNYSLKEETNSNQIIPPNSIKSINFTDDGFINASSIEMKGYLKNNSYNNNKLSNTNRSNQSRYLIPKKD